LNNEERTAYSISVSGKDVVFDNSVKNKVYGLSGREDIYELNIYAERLIVRSALSFPQTNITIYAKELIFEDHDSEQGSINTTPSPVTILTDGEGINGGNAGNISLFIKEFKGNYAKRLILNGGKGQSTNRNGTPGNGGNGGIVTSTIDISTYCDYARGSSGVKYDVAADDSNDAGSVIGTGEIGSSGRFELEHNTYAYLHPYYISAVIRHANDAFINNYTEYTLQTCKEYRAMLDEYINSAEWESCSVEEEMELQNGLTEIGDMLFRLEQGLDYFGNPVGWVPLLSFEAYFAAYDNEIERAIPTLYMYYWLSHVDKTLQHMVEASDFAASTTEKEILDCQDLLNSLVLEIPVIQDQADEVNTMIEALMQRVEILKQHLWSKAKKNVKKRNRINKAVAIVKGVANALPILGPIGAGVGGAINTVLSNSEVNKFISKQFGVDYSAAVKAVGDEACNKNFFSSLDSALTEAKSCISDFNLKGFASACKSLKNIADPLITSFKNVQEVLSHGSTPDNEVQAEFDRLTAESKEWQCLKGQVDSLNTKKIELLNHINQVTVNISTTMSELSSDVLALDGLKRDVFAGNSKRDLNAMQYLEKMEQRAKSRLLKYHYYLRKAYEYRLLRPYTGEFNLVGLYERFEKLGNALGFVEDKGAYETLGSVFKDVVSDMTFNIISEYTNSHPERSSEISLTISKEQLETINANDNLTLNLHDMGVFSPDEDNIRIVNFGIKYIKAHTEGNVGYWGHMDLDMKHSGISLFRKDGQIYWFDHMARNSTNPHVWRTKIDVHNLPEVSNPKTEQESMAISSLLSSILNNSENVMLFSRPSAWSDITMSKQVVTHQGADIVIDSLVLTLQYDYTRRMNGICNIDVTTNKNLLSYIACSVPDMNGRDNGNGDLYRSYRESSLPVTFTAVEKYGTYHFVNWTDRFGKVVSNNINLTVNRTKDQLYTANYERRVPILNVPDTIKVSHAGGVYTVNVGNTGSGDLEMDWYVSDSLSTWVYLNGDAEGLDDGSFTFTIAPNESHAYRLDSLEIFAPETDVMSKMIYIAQVDDKYLKVEDIAKDEVNVRIYPNPMREYVNIEGDVLQSVRIFSLSGREMYQKSLGGESTTSVNVSNLPNGVYIITVKTKDGVTNKKLLKTT
jgi:hypothetical protein